MVAFAGQMTGVEGYVESAASGFLAAVAMAMAMEIDPAVIRRTLASFEGVEHRIEFVRRVNGIAYINDSKGTNVDSSIQAVRAMKRPTVLILGGYDKHTDFNCHIHIRLPRFLCTRREI